MNNTQLHIISTGKQTVNKFVKTVGIVHKQVDYIHIREKTWTAAEYIEAIDMLAKQGVPLQKIIVNDRVDIVAVMNCYGVQLASHSIDVSFVKDKFQYFQIGCSVHSVQEAIDKEKQGAHFLLYGHIYETKSKDGLAPRGLSALTKVVQSVNIPVIAIGGIKPSNIVETVNTGAKGVAILSGILLADDPLKAVDQYREKLR